MPSPLSPAEIKYEIAHIHDNQGPEIVISSAVCIGLAIAAVCLRIASRRLSKAAILADDYMMVFALMMCMGQVATAIYSVHLGAGKHVILLKDPAAYAKAIISMEVLYCVGTAAFKYSALLLFHRIFGSLPHFTAFLWCFAFVIFANNIAEIFLSIFQCTPVHKAWDTEVKGSCVPVHLAAVIPAAINVVTDVITVLIPIPIIWTLQMGRNRKLQLVGIFLLSGFVCIASTYRTAIVKRLSHEDASYADVDPIIWAIVENSIGIVSATLPTLRPIFSLLIRGHYCASNGRSCERCTTGPRPSPSGGTSRTDQRARKPSPATSHWYDTLRSGDRKGSCHSNIGILEKGGVGVGEAETEALEMR